MSVVQTQPRRQTKKQDVLTSLRRSIVGGEWRPGDRLPPRGELEIRFKASGVTIQKALSQLIADGFVHARRRNGTFVADLLPHQTHYGVVFDSHRSDTQMWRRFWSSLQEQLPLMEQSHSRDLPAYFGISHAGEPDFQRLSDDLQAHRLAGLILTSTKCIIPGTFLDQIDSLPKVLLHSGPKSIAMPTVALDHDGWIDRALDLVREDGRTRVAVITHGGLQVDYGQESLLRKAFEQRGLTYHDDLIQCVDLGFAKTATSITRLMLHNNTVGRPDALIITDDNLVDPVLISLLADELRVPQDVMVVAHCNFPCATPRVLDIKRLGFDAATVMNTSIDIIDRLLDAQPVPQRTVVKPVLEEEHGT